jgi:gamma-glutamyl phosphate reductase
MIQPVRVPGQDSARALVSQPGLIPLVILRGSGDSTRSLAAEAARHRVRTMAHADGGAVLYADAAADADLAVTLVEASLDRLGVCNRLNLLLVQGSRLAGGTSCCRGSGGCWPGSASACRCRRTPTRSATSGRWTPGTRRR